MMNSGGAEFPSENATTQNKPEEQLLTEIRDLLKPPAK
jgi:hypothetical protein